MKRAVDKVLARDPNVVLRHFALVAAAAAVATLAMIAAAAAQENPGMRPMPGHITEAPVGHRQPHEWNLPHKLQRDEGHRTGPQIDFDKQLQICRGC
jgi:hypothetical protein